MEQENLNSPEYWDNLYLSGKAGWDMGTPTPAFVDLLESKQYAQGKTLVLGCAKGYDAVLFAEHGFQVTAIDFSGEAIKHARELAENKGVALTLVHDDVFDYSLSISDEFDYIVEYVMYCAIDPSRRPEYASMVSSLMCASGRFLSLFFPLDARPGGPPFAVSMDEVQRLFGRTLQMISIESPRRSITPRRGRELMTVWRKQ